MSKTQWTLAELAEETGLSARTIRYYISRGLLEGPPVAGRGAVYGAPHRDRLLEIKKLQGEGRMLAQIAQPSVQEELPQAAPWYRYTLAEGVVVDIRADLAPWRLKRAREVMAQAAALLKEEDR